MIVSNLLIQALILRVIFGKIGRRAIKKELPMGKRRRDDWTIVRHSDAFSKVWFVMFLIAKGCFQRVLIWWYCFGFDSKMGVWASASASASAPSKFDV